MIEQNLLEKLQSSKNLLAFSAGGDSTALLFLLLEHNIKFDIAIVDYAIRTQSKEEVAYARSLAGKNISRCHVFKAPKIETNFEAKARGIRYSFFEELIQQHQYTNLLTAHHLGDRLEWMLMQFCKGAGCAELAGMQQIEQRNNYTLIRPLLKYSKEELLEYLHTNKIKFFEDETNLDEKITRNAFRVQFANPLLEQYKEGIKKSFAYIDEDKNSLITEADITTDEEFACFESTGSKRADIFAIDKYLKSKIHMLSSHERELLKTNNCVVIGRKFVVVQENGFIYIAPYITEEFQMSHNFKEECRVLKIEPKLRKYLYKHQKLLSLFRRI